MHASEPAGLEAPRKIPPSLTAPPILIRRFCSQDVSLLHGAVRESIDQLCHWMTWCQSGYSLEDSQTFVTRSARAWERGDDFSFAIVDSANGTFLGSVGLNQLNRVHQFANIGYWVRTGRTGRGIAALAARLAARFAFDHLGLRRLEFVIPYSNFASQRVAQKSGAKFEGMLRNRLVLRGRSHDAVIYALVP